MKLAGRVTSEAATLADQAMAAVAIPDSARAVSRQQLQRRQHLEPWQSLQASRLTVQVTRLVWVRQIRDLRR